MRNYDRICECCNSLKKKHKWYRFPLFFFRCRPRPELINRLFFIPKNQFFTMKLSLVTCFLCKKFKTRLSFWWMLAELKNMCWKKNYSSKKISEEIPDSVFLCKKLTITYFNFSNSSNSTIFYGESVMSVPFIEGDDIQLIFAMNQLMILSNWYSEGKNVSLIRDVNFGVTVGYIHDLRNTSLSNLMETNSNFQQWKLYLCVALKFLKPSPLISAVPRRMFQL